MYRFLLNIIFSIFYFSFINNTKGQHIVLCKSVENGTPIGEIQNLSLNQEGAVINIFYKNKNKIVGDNAIIVLYRNGNLYKEINVPLDKCKFRIQHAVKFDKSGIYDVFINDSKGNKLQSKSIVVDYK